MTLPAPAQGRIRSLVIDEIVEWELQCPACSHWGGIDDDQLHGRVSVNHGPRQPGEGPEISNGCGCGCTFHETRDWFTTAERA